MKFFQLELLEVSIHSVLQTDSFVKISRRPIRAVQTSFVLHFEQIWNIFFVLFFNVFNASLVSNI